MTARRTRTGAGGPSFCWYCARQLRRAPGKGMGLFYFNIVRDPLGAEHRVHGQRCTRMAREDGNVLMEPDR